MTVKWNPWWIAMFAIISAVLLISAFFTGFWDWVTLAVVLFGIPEYIACQVKDDGFPPLTHIIIRYLHPEVGMPLLFLCSGAVGSYWIGFRHPIKLGLLVGFVGWLIAHFLPKWYWNPRV